MTHYIWLICNDFSPNRPSEDPHYFLIFSHIICWRATHKNTVYEVLDLLKKCLASISPKITKKTENDTVGRYRFGWNFDSKFYVRKQICWAMDESGCGFGFEFMRKSKLAKKKLKIKTNTNYWIWWFLIFCILITCSCSSQKQPERNSCKQ